EFDQSPVVALNRAVALANIRGPKAGLQAVRSIRGLNKLSSYYLLYAVQGEFEMRSGNLQVAAEQFRKSFELADTKSERAFLLKGFSSVMFFLFKNVFLDRLEMRRTYAEKAITILPMKITEA